MADVKKMATREGYGKAPNAEEYAKAMEELNGILAELEGK